MEPNPITVTAVTPLTPAERRLLARDQFAVLGDLLNERTFHYILAFGIREGWHCWKDGVGGASVPSWLAERVGPAGRVLASDIGTSALARPAMVAAGFATEDEIDRHLGDLDRPDLDIAVFPIVSAWGRKQPDQQIRTTQ